MPRKGRQWHRHQRTGAQKKQVGNVIARNRDGRRIGGAFEEFLQRSQSDIAGSLKHQNSIRL